MSLIVIKETNKVEYQAESSDISSGSIQGATWIGAEVYLTDTAKWYRVDTDFQLVEINSAIIGAGENHIGYISGHGKTISASPVITAGSYSAGDAVGGLITFVNAARVSGGGGVLKQVVLVDDAGQDAEMELWLFNATFTAIADNLAWAPSEADLEKLICVVSTTDGAWRAAGTPSANVIEVAQRYDLTGTSMFGQLVTRGTPTFAATDDVTVKIGLLQD